MSRAEHWKNFQLGEELDVSGTFIYNGLRRFLEIRTFDRSTDLFEIFYQLSIGFERLMKIAIVLLDHDGTSSQEEFEKSLVTHNLQALLTRIEKNANLGISKPDRAFLNVLTGFYENLRYDRFSLDSTLVLEKERLSLFGFLEKQLGVEFEERDSIFAHENTEQYKKFIREIIVKIASALYELIKQRASDLQLYTYELHSGSKAENRLSPQSGYPH